MAVVTPAKLAANRRNAQKSTGPRTAAGKKRSSQNARKHGLFSRSIRPQDPDVESTKAYRGFLKQLRAEFHPADPMEELLIERAAASLWRLRWAHCIEAGALQAGDNAAAIHCLPKIVRYENMLDRQLDRALTALRLRRALGLTQTHRPCLIPAAEGD